MASVQLVQQWPSGETLIITVSTDEHDSGYPDQLAELQARAKDLYTQLVTEPVEEV